MAGIRAFTASRRAVKDPSDPFPLWGHKEMEKSIALLADK